MPAVGLLQSPTRLVYHFIMGQSKNLSLFSIVFVVFATKISCVEDLLDENTCNWICKSESSGTDVKEFRKIMSQGKLMKLKVAYNERIDQACANETDATSNTTTFAEVWVKEIDASIGVIVSLSYTGLAEIYSGQFLLGGYKQQMNVSCVFKSTSRPGTNHPSPRLAFYTPDSVMYYVEQLSNVNSRNASFLTLIRTENQTRITVNVPSSSARDSSATTKDKEITVSDEWILLTVMILIGFVLYSSAVLLLCRPSEITILLSKGRTRRQRSHAQERGDDENNYTTENGDDSPQEHDWRTEDDVFSGSRRERNENGNDRPQEHDWRTEEDGDDNLQERERAEHDVPSAPRLVDITDFTPRDLDSETRESAETHISREAETPDGGHSEMVASAGRPIPFKDFGEKIRSPSVHLPSKTTEDRELGSLDDGAISSDEEQSCVAADDSLDPASYSLRTQDRNLMALASSWAEPHPVYQPMEPFENVNVNGRDVSTETENNSNSRQNAERSNEEATDAYPTNSVEDLNLNNTENDNTNGEVTCTAVDIFDSSDTVDHNSTTNSSEQAISHGTQTYARMIIVGGPSPVSFGSWIGNTFFSQLNKTLFRRWGKFILITFLPFLAFTSLGDFMLRFLPKLDPRIGSYLPYPHLTGSMFNYLKNHDPILLFWVIFSFICYFIRSVFIHGLISGKFPATNTSWTTCFVHRRHFMCYVYDLVQSLPLQFALPKSFCGWNSPCQGRHQLIIACRILQIVSHMLHDTCHPCDVCKNSPIQCPTDLQVPDNILHNLKELTNVVINHYNCFTQCLKIVKQDLTYVPEEVCGNRSLILKIVAVLLNILIFSVLKVIVSALAVIILLLVDVVLSSPLFCLCHGRRWILKERFKNRFLGSSFILPTLEIILVGFSLVWKVFFSLSSAVIMKIVIISSIKTLTYHPRELLPHFTVVIQLFHYFWSCYSCFKEPFCDLVSKLFTSYRKKFDELQKEGGLNELINYKQGEYAKLIPKELFSYACEHELICIRVRDRVAILLLKLAVTSFLLSFVYPAIHAQDSDSDVIIVLLITFLVSGYMKINDFVNKSESEVSEEDADKVVDDYIKKKQ